MLGKLPTTSQSSPELHQVVGEFNGLDAPLHDVAQLHNHFISSQAVGQELGLTISMYVPFPYIPIIVQCSSLATCANNPSRRTGDFRWLFMGLESQGRFPRHHPSQQDPTVIEPISRGEQNQRSFSVVASARTLRWRLAC